MKLFRTLALVMAIMLVLGACGDEPSAPSTNEAGQVGTQDVAAPVDSSDEEATATGAQPVEDEQPVEDDNDPAEDEPAEDEQPVEDDNDPAEGESAEDEQPAEDNNDTAEGEPGTWLIMLYSDADDEVLEADIFTDLNEAELVGSTEQVQIVAQLDRYAGAFDGDGDWTSTKRFYVTQDDDLTTIGSEEIEDLGEINMADGQSLVDFAIWGITTYPAEHYVLILSDHGMGWPGGWNDPDPEGPGPDGLPLTANGDLLLLSEMDAAMDLIIAETGITKFELIGFDACLMGHLEVAAAMQPYANYVVASQEVEPSLGWAYTSFLTALNADPAMDGAALSKAIVDSYIAEDQRILDDTARTNFVGDASPEEVLKVLGADVTLSAIQTSALPDVLAGLDALAVALVSEDQSLVAEARTYAQSFANVFDPDLPDPYIDLGHFASVLQALSENAEVDAAVDQLLTAIGAAVVAEKHGPDRPGATGLSIYFPDSDLYETSFGGYEIYPEVSSRFADTSLWDGFLDYHYYEVPLDGSDAEEPTRATLLAPGATVLTLDPLEISAEQITVNESATINTTVKGDKIGFIYSFTGYYDPENDTILIADQDFIEGDDTREIGGVYYPDWGDTNEVTLDHEWRPVVFGINDGTKTEFALFQPEDYGAPDEDFTYLVEGIYTFANGGKRYAELLFREDELQQIFGYMNEDGSGAPREINPKPGDTFTVLNQLIQLNEESEEVEYISEEGATLTFGEETFTLEELPAPAGDYVLGIIAEDLDGNAYEEYISITVTEE